MGGVGPAEVIMASALIIVCGCLYLFCLGGVGVYKGVGAYLLLSGLMGGCLEGFSEEV